MKNILIKTLGIAFLATSLVSCDLDIYPTNKLVSEEAFETYDDATNFANGLNTYYRTMFYGVYSETEEVQGPWFNAQADFGNRKGDVHRMDETLTSSSYDFEDVWEGTYYSIKQFNNFINNIDKIEGSADETTELQEFKGRAFLYRASAYFELLRRFAKDYDASTADSDLGVPLILKIDVNEKPARNTVAECVAQITSDLDSAALGLANVPGAAASIYPTIDAVKALKAEVALYSDDYTEAASVSKELIDGGQYILNSDSTSFSNEWTYDSGQECILQMTTTKSSESANTNSIYIIYDPANDVYSPDFLPTQSLLNLYGSNDLRIKYWFTKYDNVKIGTSNIPLTIFTKYPGNPNFDDASNRSYKHKPKVFTIGKIYLINAEANIMKATPDSASARLSLNALQSARQGNITEPTMENIKAEWARETIGEGLYIECLKRWHEGFNGRLPQNIEAITSNPASSFQEINLAADYPKLIYWPIPSYEIKVNPNLVQNSGWGIE